MNNELGKRIRRLRIAKGISQEQLADQAGIRRQKLAGIEEGISPVTLDILTRIADVLSVTVGDITEILEEVPEERCADGSAAKLMEMLDLFYANKRMYTRLQLNGR